MTKQKFLVFLLFVVVAGLAVAPAIYAQEEEALGPQGPCATENISLGNCIVAIYRWALGLAVLLALAFIIFSGYYYMSAGGDAQKVQSAKDMFTNAFIGLIILFAAVLILRTINPDLVKFREDITSEGTSLSPPDPDVAGSFERATVPRGTGVAK